MSPVISLTTEERNTINLPHWVLYQVLLTDFWTIRTYKLTFLITREPLMIKIRKGHYTVMNSNGTAEQSLGLNPGFTTY